MSRDNDDEQDTWQSYLPWTASPQQAPKVVQTVLTANVRVPSVLVTFSSKTSDTSLPTPLPLSILKLELEELQLEAILSADIDVDAAIKHVRVTPSICESAQQFDAIVELSPGRMAGDAVALKCKLSQCDGEITGCNGSISLGVLSCSLNQQVVSLLIGMVDAFADCVRGTPATHLKALRRKKSNQDWIPFSFSLSGNITYVVCFCFIFHSSVRVVLMSASHVVHRSASIQYANTSTSNVLRLKVDSCHGSARASEDKSM